MECQSVYWHMWLRHLATRLQWGEAADLFPSKATFKQSKTSTRWLQRHKRKFNELWKCWWKHSKLSNGSGEVLKQLMGSCDSMSSFCSHIWQSTIELRDRSAHRIRKYGRIEWCTHAGPNIQIVARTIYARNCVESFVTCALFDSHQIDLLIYAIVIWSRWLEMINSYVSRCSLLAVATASQPNCVERTNYDANRIDCAWSGMHFISEMSS